MSRVCNKCGNPVVPETEIKEYPFYCPNCDENMYEFETHEIEMKQGCKVVIQDSDNYGEVLGILTVKGKTFDDLSNEFDSYRQKFGDNWSWEGFLEHLIDEVKWNVCWNSEDVWSLSI